MHAYGGEGPDDAEIGRRWRENSSLEKWFPLTAERLVALEAENAALKREAHTWWTAARDAMKPRDPLTRQQIDAVMTEHYPLSSLLREEVDAFEACVRDIERLHGIGA